MLGQAGQREQRVEALIGESTYLLNVDRQPLGAAS